MHRIRPLNASSVHSLQAEVGGPTYRRELIDLRVLLPVVADVFRASFAERKLRLVGMTVRIDRLLGLELGRLWLRGRIRFARCIGWGIAWRRSGVNEIALKKG